MRALLSLILLAIVTTVLPGCFTNTVVDEFSTEIVLPSAPELVEPVEVRKRYRFSQDPRQAENIEIVRLSLEVVPEGFDLAVLQRIVLYAELESGELIPLGVAEGIEPGARRVEVEVLFSDDLADLVRVDDRLVLVWYLEGNQWYNDLEFEELELLGRAVMEITL